MQDLTPAKPRTRRATLDSTYFEYIDRARDEARTTFPYAYGNLINPQCSLQEHLDSGQPISERPSTPHDDSDNSDCETQADSLVSTPSLGQHPSSFVEADNTWGTSSENWTKPMEPSEWTCGAPGDWDLPRDRPKEKWGPHPGHKYAKTNTQYIGNLNTWRYDVVTDVEIYRVSTIRDDFRGSHQSNNWTDEMKNAFDQYKSADRGFGDLAQAASNVQPDEWKWRRGLYENMHYEALRAAFLRIDFLRKWPNAFEKDHGTDGHWERAVTLLGNAETARRETLKVKRYWDETREPDYWDIPVNVPAVVGKLIYAISPHQYEWMRRTNDGLKAELRRKVIHDKELNDNGSHIYTAKRCPEVDYPDLPILKAELQGNHGPAPEGMACSYGTFEKLAGFWLEGNLRC